MANLSVVAQQPRSRLALVKRERVHTPLRVVVYGPGGVGKSSFLADAPGALFLDLEAGTQALEVARYSFRDDADGTTPHTYQEVLGAIDDVLRSRSPAIKMVVIDTVDRLEALIHKHVCDAAKKASIEAFGYGKGYVAATDEFRRFLAKLDELRVAGVGVAMIGHSRIGTFKNPEGDDYDRYSISVHREVAALIYHWADVVGFVHFEDGGRKEDGASRGKGWSTGRRLLSLVRSAAYDAKGRPGTPPHIDIGEAHPWAQFAASQSEAANATPESLREQIVAELDRIGVEEFTTSAGKPATRTGLLALIEGEGVPVLVRILNGLRATNAGDGQ